MYHLAKSFKIQGDEAFETGDLDWAQNRYDNLLYLLSMQQVRLREARIRVNSEHDVLVSQVNLNMRTEINDALAAVRLRLPGKPGILQRHRIYRVMGQLVWLKASECARVLYYKGIAMAKLDSPFVAIDCLHKALCYSPDNRAIQDCLCLVRYHNTDPSLHDDFHFGLCAATDGDRIIEEPEVDEAYLRSVKEGVGD